jgi:hypothetical protein
VRRRGAVRAMGNMRAGPEEMLGTKEGGGGMILDE